MTFVCVNCGSEMKELYKKYSSSVLKLMNCERCHEAGDKYIEYDPVIIIIDLILLNKMAYRHILFNTPFQNHWKLAIILLLLESYFKWVTIDVGSPRVFDHNVLRWEKSFYYTCINSIIELAVFYAVLMVYAIVWGLLFKHHLYFDYFLLWKSVSLANFCIFFVIPWLIWGGIDSETYKWFISLYIFVSQTKAFSVALNVSSLWSVISVLFAWFLKSSVGHYIASVVF